MSGRATPASTGVTSPIHRDERRGVRERHRELRAAPAPEHVGHAVEHLAIGEDVGTADLDLAAPSTPGHQGAGARKASTSSMAIGWVVVVSQAGATIGGRRSTR